MSSFLPAITDEHLARAVARLQNHDDHRLFLEYLANEALPHAVKKISGKTDHATLVSWSTVLQVINDFLELHNNAHQNWVQLAEAHKKQPQKWEG